MKVQYGYARAARTRYHAWEGKVSKHSRRIPICDYYIDIGVVFSTEEAARDLALRVEGRKLTLCPGCKRKLAIRSERRPRG